MNTPPKAACHSCNGTGIDPTVGFLDCEFCTPAFSGASLSAPEQPEPKCAACNDHGEIGCLRPDGYDGERCPDCNSDDLDSDLVVIVAALQQRLTAADELNDTTKAELAWQESDNAELRKRADVLEGQLAESERKRRDFVVAVKVETDQIEAKHSRCVVVPEGYAVVPIKPTKAMRDACQIAGKLPVWDAMMAAALKPAEGGGDDA